VHHAGNALTCGNVPRASLFSGSPGAHFRRSAPCQGGISVRRTSKRLAAKLVLAVLAVLARAVLTWGNRSLGLRGLENSRFWLVLAVLAARGLRGLAISLRGLENDLSGVVFPVQRGSREDCEDCEGYFWPSRISVFGSPGTGEARVCAGQRRAGAARQAFFWWYTAGSGNAFAQVSAVWGWRGLGNRGWMRRHESAFRGCCGAGSPRMPRRGVSGPLRVSARQASRRSTCQVRTFSWEPTGLPRST